MDHVVPRAHAPHPRPSAAAAAAVQAARMEDNRPIVVDNGTGVRRRWCGCVLTHCVVCQGGLCRYVCAGARRSADAAGSNFPDYVFPSIVGRPILRTEERESLSGAGVQIKDLMVGDEAEAARTYLQVSQPMEHGIVRDFDDMRHGASSARARRGPLTMCSVELHV